MALTISVGDLGELVKRDFCARCFWIQRKIKRLPFETHLPGIFSSIDGYVKNVVRGHFDANRRLPAWFPDVGDVATYESGLHWSRFQVTDGRSGATLRGVPDEVFRLRDGTYHVIDYKTARLSAAQDSMLPRYEVQLNAYSYISARIGIAPVEALTLLYLDPDTDLASSPQWLRRSHDDFLLGFTPKVKSVEIRPDSFIEDLLTQAASIHRLSIPPTPAGSCHNCTAVVNLVQLVT